MPFFEQGTRVWYTNKREDWCLGVVLSQQAHKLTVQPQVNALSEATPSDSGADAPVVVNAARVIAVEEGALQEQADMCAYAQLSEPVILQNVHTRFAQDRIYTYVGPILVSVNPYRPLPLYDAPTLQRYIGRQLGEEAPHLYALAEHAYRDMLREGMNQSVLISGESGAGKTEATKVILQYLAAVSGRVGGSPVERRLLEASPLLEAFGNAKTVRNNNSSRFGKNVLVYFSRVGAIQGAKIVNYLLEKSRIVAQAPEERNYHIFYQFCAGASKEERRTYGIMKANNFRYLQQCTEIPGVSDKAGFEQVRRSFDALGFAPGERASVFRSLAAILHLGNVDFVPSDKVADGSQVANMPVLNVVSDLLGVSVSNLAEALCNRSVGSSNRSSVYMRPLRVEDAIATRDALAKAIYGALFAWLVKRINKTFRFADGSKPGVSNSSSSSDSSYYASHAPFFISVLDIFGFEIFEQNSFEQFCINYANEKLQQHFNEHLFKLDQALYAQERIAWAAVSFEDNQACLDLIEKRGTGILSLLDEECRFPRATDQTLLAKLNAQHASHPHYSVPLRERTTFEVLHYAGTVRYQVDGFLEKNQDRVHEDVERLLQQSEWPFMSGLAQHGAATPAAGAAKPQRGAKGATTLGAQFKSQLADLMRTLALTSPHFVRCLKPNHAKRAQLFDRPAVLRQLRYTGVLETVRIRKAGYPRRFPYLSFLARFGNLARELLDECGRSGVPPAGAVQRLLQHLQVSAHDVQLGTTMVFLRERPYLHLEELRDRSLGLFAVRIQSVVRGFLDRRRSSRLLAAKREQERLERVERERAEQERVERERVERERAERKQAAMLPQQTPLPAADRSAHQRSTSSSSSSSLTSSDSSSPRMLHQRTPSLPPGIPPPGIPPPGLHSSLSLDDPLVRANSLDRDYVPSSSSDDEDEFVEEPTSDAISSEHSYTEDLRQFEQRFASFDLAQRALSDSDSDGDDLSVVFSRGATQVANAQNPQGGGSYLKTRRIRKVEQLAAIREAAGGGVHERPPSSILDDLKRMKSSDMLYRSDSRSQSPAASPLVAHASPQHSPLVRQRSVTEPEPQHRSQLQQCSAGLGSPSPAAASPVVAAAPFAQHFQQPAATNAYEAYKQQLARLEREQAASSSSGSSQSAGSSESCSEEDVSSTDPELDPVPADAPPRYYPMLGAQKQKLKRHGGKGKGKGRNHDRQQQLQQQHQQVQSDPAIPVSRAPPRRARDFLALNERANQLAGVRKQRTRTKCDTQERDAVLAALSPAQRQQVADARPQREPSVRGQPGQVNHLHRMFSDQAARSRADSTPEVRRERPAAKHAPRIRVNQPAAQPGRPQASNERERFQQFMREHPAPAQQPQIVGQEQVASPKRRTPAERAARQQRKAERDRIREERRLRKQQAALGAQPRATHAPASPYGHGAPATAHAQAGLTPHQQAPMSAQYHSQLPPMSPQHPAYAPIYGYPPAAYGAYPGHVPPAGSAVPHPVMQPAFPPQAHYAAHPQQMYAAQTQPQPGAYGAARH